MVQQRSLPIDFGAKRRHNVQSDFLDNDFYNSLSDHDHNSRLRDAERHRRSCKCIWRRDSLAVNGLQQRPSHSHCDHHRCSSRSNP